METYDNSEIKAFIIKYKITQEDVFSLSELHKQRLPYLYYAKKIKQIEKKYKLKFLDSGRCSRLFDKAPLICDSNYNEIMGPTKEELALAEARKKARQEKERNKRERREREESLERRLANLERIKQRLHDEEFKKCPDCAEDVKKEARLCKHCRYRWE